MCDWKRPTRYSGQSNRIGRKANIVPFRNTRFEPAMVCEIAKFATPPEYESGTLFIIKAAACKKPRFFSCFLQVRAGRQA
jgi:hypothetical protein